jgi:hypothetical protein
VVHATDFVSLSIFTQRATETNDKDVYVVVYNSLGVERSTIVQLPVSTDAVYRVSKVGSPDGESNIVSSHPVASGRAHGRASSYVLAFDTATLPALGASIFHISLSERPDDANELTKAFASSTVKSDHRRTEIEDGSSTDVKASNGIFSVLFDG